MVVGPNWSSVRIGLRSELVFGPNWSSVRIGLRSELVFGPNWSSVRIGLRSKLVSGPNGSTVRIGLRSELVFGPNWSSVRIGLQCDLVFGPNWSSVQMGVLDYQDSHTSPKIKNFWQKTPLTRETLSTSTFLNEKKTVVTVKIKFECGQKSFLKTPFAIIGRTIFWRKNHRKLTVNGIKVWRFRLGAWWKKWSMVKVEGELESLDKSIKKINFGIFRFISILIQEAMRKIFQEISPLQL